jgi:hypothetical protein
MYWGLCLATKSWGEEHPEVNEQESRKNELLLLALVIWIIWTTEIR